MFLKNFSGGIGTFFDGSKRLIFLKKRKIFQKNPPCFPVCFYFLIWLVFPCLKNQNMRRLVSKIFFWHETFGAWANCLFFDDPKKSCFFLEIQKPSFSWILAKMVKIVIFVIFDVFYVFVDFYIFSLFIKIVEMSTFYPLLRVKQAPLCIYRLL